MSIHPWTGVPLYISAFLMSATCIHMFTEMHTAEHTLVNKNTLLPQCNLHLYLNKGMFQIIMLMQSHCLPNHFPLPPQDPPPLSFSPSCTSLPPYPHLHPDLLIVHLQPPSPPSSHYLLLSLSKSLSPMPRKWSHIVTQEELRRSWSSWNAPSRCFNIWALFIACTFFLWGVAGGRIG